MRTDNNIERAVAHAFDRLRDLLAAAETRQLSDAYRPVGEAIGEGLRMLFGQQGRRRENRDLLAAHDGDKGGAQGDFRLAETDVATNQAIHRLTAGHVADDGVDGGGLIWGLFKAETLGEGFVIACRILESMALAQC